jgi:hypothetical protein
MREWAYSVNPNNSKFTTKFVVVLSYEEKSDIEDWLKDNIGKYGQDWMWWGPQGVRHDDSGYLQYPKEIYFSSDEYALAFKLAWEPSKEHA